jgi:hypothetical protein
LVLAVGAPRRCLPSKATRARSQPFVKEASENKVDDEKTHEAAAYDDILTAHKKAGLGPFAPDAPPATGR